MFNFFRKRKLKRLAIEHARKYKMEHEFLLAYSYFGDVYEALEEWDLLNDEFMMKVQAEYNQLIDIELPPIPNPQSTIANPQSPFILLI